MDDDTRSPDAISLAYKTISASITAIWAFYTYTIIKQIINYIYTKKKISINQYNLFMLL